MRKVGRNDPCPCGSGKKYKRCCLGAEEIAPATDISAVDGRVTRALVNWVLEEHKRDAEATRDLVPEALRSDEAILLLSMLTAYEVTAADGSLLCRQVPERIRRRFDAREQRWFEEQQASWFSVWDVLEVRRDEGLFLRDLLTGEERFVSEAKATHYVSDREVMLARIVRLGTRWTLAGTHPYHLPPRAAEGVVAEARRTLELGRGRVDPERLRGLAAFRLVALWDAEVRRGLAAPPPQLQNTDGDPLLWTTDTFAFEPAQRDALAERLRRHPTLEEAGDDREPAALRFALTGGADEHTLIASVTVGAEEMAIETNSTRRADDMREEIEAYVGALVRFTGRSEQDAGSLVGETAGLGEGAAPPGVPPEVAAGIVRQFKEKHYAEWPDIPVPALDGLTPREAARDKRRKVYRELQLLLREMEATEARSPPAERYDVNVLRRELDVEP